MRIFVAGATGAIGPRLVPMLVEAGHDVTGMTRSQDKTEALRGAGGEPIVCDALDADAVRDAVAAAAPEVVVHQLTAIPPAINPRRMADDFARATIAAVEGGPPGAYNIVDDEPAPVSEWLPVYAAALGAGRPRRLPLWLVRLVAGPYAVYGMSRARGASNVRARERLGWQPQFASWRQGFADALK